MEHRNLAIRRGMDVQFDDVGPGGKRRAHRGQGVLDEAMLGRKNPGRRACRRPQPRHAIGLGKTTMRELKTAQFSTTVRGAPLTGEYVTISYLTKFASAPLATETLIVSKEADGVWRIAGYNIAKAPDQ